MPRKIAKPRLGAGQSPVSRPNRRKVRAKQANPPGNLARHSRAASQQLRPMKFPGKLGGR